MNKINNMYKVFIILVVLILTCLSCKKWDLERINFIELAILETEATSLSTLNVQANIKGINDANLEQHGFIWSAFDSIPDKTSFNISEVQLGARNENGDFLSTLSDLNIQTTYFIRAFAELDTEVYYSDVITYKNEDRITVDTIGLKAILGTSTATATSSLSGLLSDETIQEYGHCWSNTNPLPEISDNSTNLGLATGNVTFFESVITNLAPQKTYYVRAYATIAGIVIYGPTQTLKKGNYWVKRSGLPGTGVQRPKYFSVDGKGYFVLGVRNNNSNEMWEYTPETDSWRQLPSFPGAYRELAFGVSHNRKICIGLGTSNTASTATHYTDVWEFDLDTELWTEKASFPGEPRSGTVDFNFDGTIYLAFGAQRIPNTSNTIRYDDVWQFDPDWDNGVGNQKGKWSLFANCEESIKRFQGAGFVINGVGYMVCGGGIHVSLKNEVWGFKPNVFGNNHCQQYSSFANIQASRRVFGLVWDDQNAYLGCGHNGDRATGQFWQFDPSVYNEGTSFYGKWTQLENFANGTEERAEVLAFMLNGRIFMGFGGNSQTGIDANNLWEYIPDK